MRGTYGCNEHLPSTGKEKGRERESRRDLDVTDALRGAEGTLFRAEDHPPRGGSAISGPRPRTSIDQSMALTVRGTRSTNWIPVSTVILI